MFRHVGIKVVVEPGGFSASMQTYITTYDEHVLAMCMQTLTRSVGCLCALFVVMQSYNQQGGVSVFVHYVLGPD